MVLHIVVATTLALSPGLPKAGIERLPGVIARPVAAARNLAGPLSTTAFVATPALAADGGGIGDTITNAILSVVILGFLGVIASFALEAGKECADGRLAIAAQTTALCPAATTDSVCRRRAGWEARE